MIIHNEELKSHPAQVEWLVCYGNSFDKDLGFDSRDAAFHFYMKELRAGKNVSIVSHIS
jgi:hypothetical protein